MKTTARYSKYTVALLLMGSATVLLNSCGTDKGGVPNPETMVTQEADSLFSVQSKNGMKSYRFKAAKRISYDLAREPYDVYPQGVFVEKFRDSTEVIESSLTADYAINHKSRTRSLWEAIGNVVATGEDGRTLYTEQLFWDEQTERIYSNVDCKMVQKDGIYMGSGIESDQALKYWKFRNTISKLDIDSPSGEQSTRTESRLPDAGEIAPEENVGSLTPPVGTPRPAQTETGRTEQPGQDAPKGNASGRTGTDRGESRRPTIQPVEEAESATGADPAAGRMSGRRESHLQQGRGDATGNQMQPQKRRQKE